MDPLNPDLDDLDKGQIEALVAEMMGVRAKSEGPVVPKPPVIKARSKRRLKALPGDLPDHTRMNDTITVSIDLPTYLVVGMQEFGEHAYRLAVREFLIKRGKTWWYPRFLKDRG